MSQRTSGLAQRDDDVVVPSPCTGVCRIGSREHCLGCGRKLDEIAGWSSAPTQRRLNIRAQAAERLRLYPESGA